MLGALSSSVVAAAADAFRFEAPLTAVFDEVDTLRFIDLIEL